MNLKTTTTTEVECMEDDLFLLIDFDGDGAVTLDETTRYFERHNFMRDKDSALNEKGTPLVFFKETRIDVTTFRELVKLLCAHCRVTLGKVWSVCVEQAVYSVFRANALVPEMVVSRKAMEQLEQHIMRHGETPLPDAALLKWNTFPEYLDYGEFVEYFLVRWPNLSRAKVAALLRHAGSEHFHEVPPSDLETEIIENGAVDQTQTEEGREDEMEQLLRYTAQLKATLRSREEAVEKADELAAQNTILLETLAVAEEEHMRSQEQIKSLSRKLQELQSEIEKNVSIPHTSFPPSVSESYACSVGEVSNDDARMLSLVQRFCRKREQAEMSKELFLQERASQLEKQREFLLQWEEALHTKEGKMVQRELEIRKRWSEAFLRKERQLERLQETLELKRLEIAAREAAIEKRRLAQLERDREVGELSLGERRRRMQQLQFIEAKLHKREERALAREEEGLRHAVGFGEHHRPRKPVQQLARGHMENIGESQPTDGGATDSRVLSPSKCRTPYLSLLS
ncbi:hypothetical protein TCSYLVIO_002966 [Trypanosoma cruzi]|nr:hypothetical protein TCSYLVIO_002966 [Trypanosoma cruzi]